MQHRALPPLLQLLNSPSSKVQYNAAFVLYELSDSREVAAHMQQVRGVQHLLAASQKMQVSHVRNDKDIVCTTLHDISPQCAPTEHAAGVVVVFNLVLLLILTVSCCRFC